MNAAEEITKTSTQDFRERLHHFSKLPVSSVLTTRMEELGVKNVELAQALDYARPNVIAMMKSGSMRLPANRVKEAARVLKLDPVFLLGKVIAESDKALWDVISGVMGDRLVSANELALIELVRQELDGFDVDLTQNPEFIQAALSVLKAIVRKESAESDAAMRRIKKEPV